MLVRLVAQIASRFGVVVTQKLAAQAVPVIGAFGGAAVNYAFIDHFQEIARAHFTVRRLERRYGKDVVRMAYDKLSAAATPCGIDSLLFYDRWWVPLASESLHARRIEPHGEIE